MDFTNFVRNFLTLLIGIGILVLIVSLAISLAPIILVIVLAIWIYNLLFTPKVKRVKKVFIYRNINTNTSDFSEERFNKDSQDTNQVNSNSAPLNIKEVEVEVRDPESKN